LIRPSINEPSTIPDAIRVGTPDHQTVAGYDENLMNNESVLQIDFENNYNSSVE